MFLLAKYHISPKKKAQRLHPKAFTAPSYCICCNELLQFSPPEDNSLKSGTSSGFTVWQLQNLTVRNNYNIVKEKRYKYFVC